jgi:hypothetical protein
MKLFSWFTRKRTTALQRVLVTDVLGACTPPQNSINTSAFVSQYQSFGRPTPPSFCLFARARARLPLALTTHMDARAPLHIRCSAQPDARICSE